MNRAAQVSTVNLLGVRVHALTLIQLHQLLADAVTRDAHSLVLNVNVHCLNLAYDHAWLQGFLNDAPLVFCDGAGVMLGARLLGRSIPERITYADWIWQLAEFCERQQFTMFFLGGRPGVAARAADRLHSLHPRLHIVGTQHGFFNKARCSAENSQVVEAVNRTRPNLLLVAFGMPLQERWLMENWDRIDANVALTGGAVFDYLTGELRRAPRWLTAHGLEWLGRLVIEPRRLWKRYLLGNPLFLWRVLRQRWRSPDQ